MLGQRPRRWAYIRPTLAQPLVLTQLGLELPRKHDWLTNVLLMLVQCRRRSATANLSLGERIVFAVTAVIPDIKLININHKLHVY